MSGRLPEASASTRTAGSTATTSIGLGHGTAVTAAIKEKAPDAELYAVKVFDRTLGTRIANLIAAIDWAAAEGMQVANLSLGTSKVEHERALRDAVDQAAARGLLIVSARDDEGVRWLPGSLPGVIPVQLDWACSARRSTASPTSTGRPCSVRQDSRGWDSRRAARAQSQRDQLRGREHDRLRRTRAGGVARPIAADAWSLISERPRRIDP